MTHESVHVPLAGRSYDVLIGSGLLRDCGTWMRPLLQRERVFVVTDEIVAHHHAKAFNQACDDSGIACHWLTLPSGESTKSWDHLRDVVEWFLDQKVERRDVVVAFGGGVIGDLVGFAASILRRGVRFVQVPTTLLAQVDSSVGGKTGINTRHGKNLVGAFHQPSLVLADTDMLATLSNRDFLAGYGEVVKYGLLGDRAFFEWLEESGSDLLARNHAALTRAVYRSVEMKAEIVVRDETEQGDRAFLNLGHTFCHALEAATDYSKRLLHGEGVAIGCALATDLSYRLGYAGQEDPGRVIAHLRAMGMKAALSDIDGALPNSDALLALMGQDKKVIDGALRFVLMRGIGHAFVTADVPEATVLEVLEDAR